jgi:hypothetical protein
MWELCKRLDSPAASVVAWRLGHSEMPNAKFLALVEILMEIDPDWTNKTAST